MVNQHRAIQPGRPRLQVDYALILRLRDVENLGWSRGAEEYRKRTGQWISRDTFKRRYYEAKAAESPGAKIKRAFEEFEWKSKL
jgi:hypothetical protein